MMRRALLLAGLASLSAAASAGELPEVVFARGALILRRLPAVLDEPALARHLHTGLTTAFVFTVKAGRIDGRSIEGQSQVRIRYDLWDERYVVERWDAGSAPPVVATLPRSELASWWRSLSLWYRPAPALRSSPARAKIELLVLPFSQAEQRDAQDWLLRSLSSPDQARAHEPPDGQRQAVGAEPLRELYGSMLAASIGRRSLITYSWTVAVAPASP